MDRDLTKEVIEKIESLVASAKSKDNKVLEIGGKPYSTDGLQRIYADENRPESLVVSSLRSISDYWNLVGDLEGVNTNDLFLLIESPQTAIIVERFKGEEKKRASVITAVLKNDVDPFQFDRFMPTEAFVIGLMSRFQPGEDRDYVVKVASGLVSESKIAGKDTGQTMKVEAHAGVVNQSGLEDRAVVVLRPFRTFREVDQPSSAFLFRYKAEGDGVGCALFEADGGAWRHEAMQNIRKYFQKEAKSLPILS